MTATVTLVTDRPAFVPVWRDVLERHAFAVRVHAPSDLGRFAVHGSAVVFDAASDSLDDDDLLTGVGYVRAAGGVAIVHAESDLEPIVLEAWSRAPSPTSSASSARSDGGSIWIAENASSS